MNDQTFGFDAPLSMQVGRVAVLADGENLPFSTVSGFLSDSGRGQTEVIHRAWCNRLNANGWEAAHGFDVTYLNTLSGKNSADIHLVIEAMQIAHDKLVDGFVILSTDRDFAPLAYALRRMGLWVIGVGRAETSILFREACSRFYQLAQKVEPDLQTPLAKPAPAKAVQTPLSPVDTALKAIICAYGDAGGGIALKSLGSEMSKLKILLLNTGFSTWFRYLSSKPSMYAVSGPSDARIVRLARP